MKVLSSQSRELKSSSMITQDIVNITMSHAVKMVPDNWDSDDAASYALKCMIARDERYDGTTPYKAYLIHYMKRDIIDYLRINYKKREGLRFQPNLSSLASEEFLEQHIYERRHAEDKEYAKNLLEWCYKETGTPMAAMLALGYKGKEVAVKLGLTPGRVSHIRKRLYEKAIRTRRI